MAGLLADVGEQVLREDVEALLLDRLLAAELRVGIRQVAVVEALVARQPLLLVEVGGQVLGDEAVEEHPEHVGLEVPAVDAAAQVVGDPPDGLVELCALGSPWWCWSCEFLYERGEVFSGELGVGIGAAVDEDQAF